jgi:hypothetical protein
LAPKPSIVSLPGCRELAGKCAGLSEWERSSAPKK